MKKRLLLCVLTVAALCFVFSTGASAFETYDDAPAKTVVQTLNSDVVLFDDGFSCPSAYIVKDKESLEFDFSYINTKGHSYVIGNVIEFDIPEGITSTPSRIFGSNKTIQKVSIPKTVTEISDCMFEYASSLTQCTFEHTADSNLQTIPSWTFAYCTSLQAISFPDCVKYIKGNTQLGGCTALTAIYLPKSLISTEGYGNSSATFGGCTNAYFVNEPFTYDAIPSKPEVYYFPSGYSSMSGETFDTCKNLNNVLVFGKDMTTIENAWSFENVQNGNGGKPIVVFLGDAESMAVGSWNVSAIYFANKNDKSASDVGLSGSKTVYYCNADGNTHHLESPRDTVIVKENCVENRFVEAKCFCKKTLSSQEIENTANGIHTYAADDFDCTTAVVCLIEKCQHVETEAVSHVEEHSVVYVDGYMKNGAHNTFCSNEGCKALDNTEALEPMFFPNGYSYRFGSQTGISAQFKVNTKALVLYEKYEKELVFGIIITNEKYVNDSFIKDGKLNTQENKGIQVEMISRSYSYFNCFISGFDMDNTQHTSLGLVVAGYVYEKDDASSISYLQKSYEGNSPYASTCVKDASLGVVTIGKIKEFSGE